MANSGLVNLSIGEASFGAPRKVLDAVRDAVSTAETGARTFDHYANSRGTPALRRAIARRYERLYGLRIDPETEVLVTYGAAEAIWLSVFTLTNAGDDVLMPDPHYVIYDGITDSLGRRTVTMPTTAEAGFRIDAAQLAAAITPASRLLILNSPANPTGAMYGQPELQSILEVARARGTTVLHDEVFDRITFGEEHRPLAAFDPRLENTIVVNSVSKLFGMTGWRIGWMVARREIIDLALKAHTYVSLAVPTLLQDAITGAVNDPAVDAEVERNVAALQARVARVARELESLGGFDFPDGLPRAGFYLFPRVTALAERLGMQNESSVSEAVTRFLMDECGVAVVPGNVYGRGGEGYIRLVIAAPDDVLDEALSRIRGVLTHKPPVTDGIAP
jgi:aspartate/methionine/tyrosine aminotransferase